MKKLISLLLLITLLFTLSACEWNFDFESRISEYGKVNKYTLHLDEYLNADYRVGDGVYGFNSVADVKSSVQSADETFYEESIRSKLEEYDESFFANNILLVVPLLSVNSGNKYDFVGIKYTDAALTVVVNEKQSIGSAVDVVTFIYFVIELPRDMADGFDTFEVKRI